MKTKFHRDPRIEIVVRLIVDVRSPSFSTAKNRKNQPQLRDRMRHPSSSNPQRHRPAGFQQSGFPRHCRSAAPAAQQVDHRGLDLDQVAS
jgi:hypothetical protein